MAEFISLHTIKRKFEGKSVEIKPNTVFELDSKADAAEIDHLLKAKAMKPYRAEDTAPERLAPVKKSETGKKAPGGKKTDGADKKTDDGAGKGAEDNTGNELV